MRMALPPQYLQPLGTEGGWRRHLWLSPAALALVFAALVALWAGSLDTAERAAFRQTLEADASSVDAQLLAQLDAERARLRDIARLLPAPPLGTDAALASMPEARAGLDRLWNRLVWLDANHQVVARAARQAPLHSAGATALQIRTRGQAQHLEVAAPDAAAPASGQLLARYEITDLLGSTDLVWLNHRYELSFVSALGEVIATTARLGRTPAGQAYERKLGAFADTAVVLRPFAAPVPWWQRPQTLSLLAGLLVLGAGASLLLRRQIHRVSQAMNEARTEAAWRQAMEDSALVGLRARDLQGRILYVNRTLCEMVGYSAAELVGLLPPLPFWPPDAIDAMMARNLDTLAGSAPATGYETHWRHRDGHGVDVMIFESRLVNPQGRHVGWMGSIVDISDRKQLEERERRHTELMAQHARLNEVGLLASELAHELTQPLTAVIGYSAGLLKAMRSQPAADPALVDASDKVHQNARKAGDIVNWIRRQTQRTDPQRTPQDLNVVVNAVCSLRARQLARQQVQLRLDLAAGLPPVAVERVGIEQVLANLVRNAADAVAGRPGKAVIAVSTRRSDAGVSVEVHDNGPGLQGRTLDALCAPFFTTKDKGLGMGLGLGICRAILEGHGASLEAADAPGGGAVFRFTLMAPTPPEPAHQKALT